MSLTWPVLGSLGSATRVRDEADVQPGSAGIGEGCMVSSDTGTLGVVVGQGAGVACSSPPGKHTLVTPDFPCYGCVRALPHVGTVSTRQR